MIKRDSHIRLVRRGWWKCTFDQTAEEAGALAYCTEMSLPVLFGVLHGEEPSISLEYRTENGLPSLWRTVWRRALERWSIERGVGV